MPYFSISLGFVISSTTASCSCEAANVTVSVATSILLLRAWIITTVNTVTKRRSEATSRDLYLIKTLPITFCNFCNRFVTYWLRVIL